MDIGGLNGLCHGNRVVRAMPVLETRLGPGHRVGGLTVVIHVWGGRRVLTRRRFGCRGCSTPFRQSLHQHIKYGDEEYRQNSCGDHATEDRRS